ncbi:MAG: alpha-L-fucosidase [Promethearchaeota archaeon]
MKTFEGTVDSLEGYKCPDWFRDLKFGIYFHWGPMSVPAVDGWYARNMYKEGSGAYKFHVKHYGHPSEVGYKDIIPMWTAENFDPDRLVSLFKEAGARYITPVAVHHDNFDLWNSRNHKWNAVNMGPKMDIIGMWRESIEKQGLVFGVTTHASRTYSWFQTSHGSDKTGEKKGVPYDGNDPDYVDYYLDAHDDDNFKAPLDPPVAWRAHWASRIKDLIDNYHPQLLYFDAAIPFQGEDGGRTGMAVIAHFYNHNLERSGGKSNGVMFIKKIKEHGVYHDGVASLDIEGHVSDNMLEEPWQTDYEIGQGWFFNRNARYRSVKTVVHTLIQIVARNGNLLLNIPIMPDGTLDKPSRIILDGLGAWLKVNGDAIYNTRPWMKSNDEHVFFTRRGNNLYMFLLKKARGKIELNPFPSDHGGFSFSGIVTVEGKEEVPFSRKDSKLTLKVSRAKFTGPVRVLVASIVEK